MSDTAGNPGLPDERPRAAIYARVSKPEQKIEHQEGNLMEYATAHGFDVVDVLRDKSTGADTDRDGYRRLMELVESGSVDVVVVRSISRIARSMVDLYSTVDEIRSHGVGLYVQSDGIEIPPGEDLTIQQKTLLNTFAFAAELERDLLIQRTNAGLRAAEAAGKWVGRPPYGFTTSDDGYLQPSDDFSKALEAIHAVDNLGWSERKTARHTGVPRRTIPSIMENRERYEVDDGEPGRSS